MLYIVIGRYGADSLGPLLPAVAEICSDLDPFEDVDPLLQKLFRNLWFYIVLYGLAPPIQKFQPPATYSRSFSTGSRGNLNVLQTVAGPYVWNTEWSTAVNRLTQCTPPLVSFSAISCWSQTLYVILENIGCFMVFYTCSASCLG